jgi:predicted ATPase
MLTAIRVGNFKAFAEAQRIPVRPLTLIYGANSSGKSSVLHSLLFAHHAAETGELDTHLTRIGGDAVDLGGFRQFVHGRNRELRVQLEWELSRQGFSAKVAELLAGISRANIGINFGLSGWQKGLVDEFGKLTPRQMMTVLVEDAREKGDQAKVEMLESTLEEYEDKLTLEEVSKLRSIVRVEGFWLELDERKFMAASVRPDGHLRLDTLDQEHGALKFLIESLILAHSTTDRISQQEVLEMQNTIDEIVPKISFEVEKLLPERLVLAEKSAATSKALSLFPVRKETRLEDLRKVIEGYLPGILEEIVVGVSSGIKRQLRRLTYLGPLRTYPPRHIGISETNDPNWEAGGGSAWEVVRRDSRLRQKVNEWLADEKKLSTSYELRIRNLITVESLKSKMAELASKAVSEVWDGAFEPDEEGVYKDVLGEIEEALMDVPERLQKMETLFSDMNELVIYDKRSKTIVSHRDVGIGISQVLPVIVTSFVSKEKIFAIEQPEIHLHPALQAELGDVFIEAALGERKNTLIVETHSEHLLLRIMRRMRETAEGNGKQNLPVTPEDVCVLYVDQPKGKNSSVVYEIRLDRDGTLLDPWPGGFFEEGFRERFL